MLKMFFKIIYYTTFKLYILDNNNVIFIIYTLLYYITAAQCGFVGSSTVVRRSCRLRDGDCLPLSIKQLSAVFLYKYTLLYIRFVFMRTCLGMVRSDVVLATGTIITHGVLGRGSTIF